MMKLGNSIAAVLVAPICALLVSSAFGDPPPPGTPCTSAYVLTCDDPCYKDVWQGPDACCNTYASPNGSLCCMRYCSYERCKPPPETDPPCATGYVHTYTLGTTHGPSMRCTVDSFGRPMCAEYV